MFKKLSYLFSFIILFSTENIFSADFRYLYESYLFQDFQKSSETDLNPNNQIWNNPEKIYNWDQRLELKWLFDQSKLVLRPRLIIDHQDRPNAEGVRTTLNYDFTDAFVENSLSDSVILTWGLHVYQWGPAEIINPSNPFFHFSFNQRSLVYKEKGQQLVRLNWNLNNQNSLIFVSQPVSNNDPAWIADTNFKKQWMLKYDWKSMKNRNYFGVSLGQPDNGDAFFGEYLHLENRFGYSFYFDAQQITNKYYYVPDATLPVPALVENDRSNKNKLSHLDVVGFRYEGGVDIRLEYIYNSAGYNKKQFDDLVTIDAQFLSPLYVQNLRRTNYSGLDLLSQNYGYFSFRKSNFLKKEDFNIYLRYFHSFLDQSSVAQFETEFPFSFVNVFASYSQNSGKKNSEFKITNDWRATIGIKVVQ